MGEAGFAIALLLCLLLGSAGGALVYHLWQRSERVRDEARVREVSGEIETRTEDRREREANRSDQEAAAKLIKNARRGL